MEIKFHNVGLIGKYGDPGITDTLAALRQFFVSRQLNPFLDAETARCWPNHGMATADRDELGRRCDLIVVVGGDGTMLNVARSITDYGIPVVGINLGRLGFLVDISPEDMLQCLDEILQGHYVSEERFLLQARIVRGGNIIGESVAFNDVVVHKWNMLRMIEFETQINGQFVDVQRSDGLIVSTPTGSTAYALSGGGPILYPTLDAIALVPICPHTLSNRPIVIAGDSEIEIIIRECNRDHAQLTCDGQNMFSLCPGDRIQVSRKEPRLRLIHPANHDHFKILRTKLKWGSKQE